jgi:uncharacterized protein YcgI (DUF1989 family)
MRRSETFLLVAAAMAGLLSAVAHRRCTRTVTGALADYGARLDDLADLNGVFLDVELDQVGMLRRVVDQLPEPSGPQRLAG